MCYWDSNSRLLDVPLDQGSHFSTADKLIRVRFWQVIDMQIIFNPDCILGSGCGAVGRTVASDTSDSNPVIGNFICQQLYKKCVEKTKIKKKQAENGKVLKTRYLGTSLTSFRFFQCSIYLASIKDNLKSQVPQLIVIVQLWSHIQTLSG